MTEPLIGNVLTKLLDPHPTNTGITITFMSLPQFVYLALIYGVLALLYLVWRNRSAASKEKLLRGVTYALMVCYLGDFFLQKLTVDGMTPEKLPFHVCIVVAVLIPFAQFHRKGRKLMEAVVPMAILSPMMYLLFPMSVGDSEPWSYRSVQTMFFHSAEMIWGLLTLMLGQTRLNIRRIWMPALLLVCNTLWAKFGNLLYGHNFFFLESDALAFELVENGVLPKWTLMIINPLVYFLAVLALYGVYYAVLNRRTKHVKEPLLESLRAA